MDRPMKMPIILASLLGAAIASAQPGVPPTDEDGNASSSSSDDDLIPTTADAKAMLPIRLEDLIIVAVRLSPDLARARVDRTQAFHSAAAAQHSQAWTLTANVSGNQLRTGDQVEVPLYSIVEQDTLSAAIGIGRNLPTGGTFTLNFNTQQQHTEYALNDTVIQSAEMGMGSAGMPTMSPQEEAVNGQTSLGVTIKQPLMRGLGSIATIEIDKAELQATEATVKAQLAAEDLIKDIVTAYWELAFSTYEVDVRIQALDLAKKQEDLTHEQIRAGLAQPPALNPVQYELMTRQDDELQSENDMEKKSMELRQKAGLDLKDRHDVVLHPSDPFEVSGDDEFDLGQLLEKSRTTNRKLATVAIEERLADLDVKQAADATKPQMDLQVSAAAVGTGESLADSFSSVGSLDGYQITGSLNMSFELSGAAKRGRDAAEAKRRRINVDRADTLRQIESQTTLAYKQVQTAKTRVELGKKAMEISEENVRATRLQFIAGKEDNFKVLARQKDLTEARLKYGRAIADYHIAVAQLQYLSGFLLQQYGIDVRTHQRG